MIFIIIIIIIIVIIINNIISIIIIIILTIIITIVIIIIYGLSTCYVSYMLSQIVYISPDMLIHLSIPSNALH